MKMIKIYPYRSGSASARRLADALDCRVLRLEGSHYKPKEGDTVINWGNSTLKVFEPARTLNTGYCVSLAANKLSFFNQVNLSDAQGVRTPLYWENPENITPEDFPVVCRTVLTGHSGNGIVLANTPDELVPAKLYTKYVKKKDEFRVHCSRDTVIAIQKKYALGYVNPNYQIRSHDNGFIFIRGGFTTPDGVVEQAQAAIAACGLDFGAVDVIYNTHEDKAYTLEVNTAPGLEGQTILDYRDFFLEQCNETQ
jgi:hypothetical protein